MILTFVELLIPTVEHSPANAILCGAHEFAAILLFHVRDIHMTDDIVVYSDILTN